MAVVTACEQLVRPAREGSFHLHGAPFLSFLESVILRILFLPYLEEISPLSVSISGLWPLLYLITRSSKVAAEGRLWRKSFP